MKLSDLIIDHGPYGPGELYPFRDLAEHPSTTAELNELREELIAARKVGERLERFEIAGRGSDNNDVEIMHRDCSWFAELDAWTTLAELNRRAGEHGEVCE